MVRLAVPVRQRRAAANMARAFRDHAIIMADSLIERLAQGTPLPRDEMLRRYAGLHGSQPECYESAYS